MLNEIRKLLGAKDPQTSNIEKAAALLPAEVDRARKEKSGLEEQRRALLLSGSDAEIEAIETRVAAAARHVDRLDVMAVEIQSRLESARQRDATATRDAERKAAEAEVAAAVAALKTYPKAALEIRKIIDKAIAAQRAVDAFNRKAVEGEEPLLGPEDIVRTVQGKPRKALSTKPVDRWCFRETGYRLSDTDQVRVRPDDRNPMLGWLPSQSGSYSTSSVVLKTFNRTEYYAAEPAATIAPLAETVFLPGLRASDDAICAPLSNRLRFVDDEAKPPIVQAERPRAVRVEYSLASSEPSSPALREAVA